MEFPMYPINPRVLLKFDVGETLIYVSVFPCLCKLNIIQRTPLVILSTELWSTPPPVLLSFDLKCLGCWQLRKTRVVLTH
jgi:hypothetical protein